jgi:hypothetical protein
MAYYRCYFVGSNGQLVGAETISSENDDGATAAARESFQRRAYATGFDLWQADRKVAAQEAQAS